MTNLKKEKKSNKRVSPLLQGGAVHPCRKTKLFSGHPSEENLPPRDAVPADHGADARRLACHHLHKNARPRHNLPLHLPPYSHHNASVDLRHQIETLADAAADGTAPSLPANHRARCAPDENYY